MATDTLTGVLNLDLIGGYICLDFANTVHNFGTQKPRDELATYADLVVWSRRTGTVSEPDAERLLAAAGEHPGKAERVLHEGRVLRRLIFDVFSAVARNREPKGTDLRRLTDSWSDAMNHARIVATSDGFDWSWATSGLGMNQMFRPILRSATDLITSEDSKRIRLCDGHGCTWLFVDRSKNRSRRWCEMDPCGNREKSRRHYARRRKSWTDKIYPPYQGEH